MKIHSYKFFLKSLMIAFILALCIINLMATKVYATQFQVDFSGVVNGGSTVLANGNPFSFGSDTFTGSFSYNLDAVDMTADPTIGTYINALTSFSLDFGYGFSGYAIAAADIKVENDVSDADSFETISVPTTGPDITVTDSFGNTGVYSINEIWMHFLDYNPPDAISSDTLPTILPTEWFTPFVGLNYDFKSGTKVQNIYGQDYDNLGVTGFINDATAVPEPSTLLLLCSGLLGLGAFRKKFRK